MDDRARMRNAIAAAIEVADYDLWKSLFVEECREDPEEADAVIERMLDDAEAAYRSESRS